MSATAIDEWLPQFDVSASYSIPVQASAEQTYAALRQARFSDLAIVRRLMRLRGYRLEGSASGALGREGGSFLELAAIPPREVVLGIAGRFWRPGGGIVRNLSPAEFLDFHQEGYVKAAWSFLLLPAGAHTQLSTETRVQAFGRAASVKFRLYWLAVGPFSGIIRKAMLGEVKRIAEQMAA